MSGLAAMPLTFIMKVNAISAGTWFVMMNTNPAWWITSDEGLGKNDPKVLIGTDRPAPV